MNGFNIRLCRSAWLALAVAASLPTVGCQAFKPVSTTTTTSGTNPMPGGPDASASKTEFHREVGAEQEYNVHVELARFLETQGNHEAAVGEYQKAIDVCEKKGSALAHSKLGAAQHSLAQRRMASALDRLGRFAQAEPHYLKALKLTPKDTKVWNDAGYSYYLQNRLADAERTFKTAEKLEPNNPRILTNLGLTLSAEGKNEEALAALTRAGGPAVGHANLGYIVAAMGQTELAREHYQKALALQPELTAAKMALAKLDSAPTYKAPTSIASVVPPALPLLTPKPAPTSVKPAPAVAAVSAPPPVKVKDPQVSRVSGSLPPLPELPPPSYKPLGPPPPIPNY